VRIMVELTVRSIPRLVSIVRWKCDISPYEIGVWDNKSCYGVVNKLRGVVN